MSKRGIKRGILIGLMWMLSVSLPAQDFTSLFLGEHGADSVFTHVTVSPKMMGEILKDDDTEKNKDILEIIANLKSMQVLSVAEQSDMYYESALKIVENNPKRFEYFLSYENNNENCKIVVRKKKGTIVELIMLVADKKHFAIINVTGEIKPEFISTLARSVTQKHT